MKYVTPTNLEPVLGQSLTSYYNHSAKEYDKVYQIPAEQEDLLKAAKHFQEIFAGKSVIEIACGTGYWTEQISKAAASILATDINRSMIDIARERHFNCNVTLEAADMNKLETAVKFEGLFGGFIWSHILIQDLDSLLIKLQDLVTGGGEIVFIDSKPVAGTIHDTKRITRTDEWGNTFQTRQLENGTTYEVLKNFPGRDFLLDKLSQVAAEIKYIELEHYWIAACKLKSI